MSYELGQIVIIPFPYSDLQSPKRRPVLLLTSPDRHGDLIVLAITSVRIQEHAIEIDARSLTAGALPRRSWVRVDKVFTLEEGSIVKTFGAVTSAFLAQVLGGLCRRVGHVMA